MRPGFWKIGAVMVGAVLLLLLIAQAAEALLPHNASGYLILAVLAGPAVGLYRGLVYVQRRFFLREPEQYHWAVGVTLTLTLLVRAVTSAKVRASGDVFVMIGLCGLMLWMAFRDRPWGSRRNA